MILYPTIELQNGRCVSLFRGRMEEPQIWHVDPLRKAMEFAEAGADWLHITDFDAIDGSDRNAGLIDEILRTVPASVQLGGGFRSLASIGAAIDRGAGRVVLGTLPILQPQLAKEAARSFPEQIVLTVDVYKGRVLSDGWRAQSSFAPEDFIAAFDDVPLAAIVVTDIDADLDESEDALALVTRLAGLARAPVIASGLVNTLDDLSRLKYVPHVSGAIVGRAFMNRTIGIAEALAVANAPIEARAAFI